MCKSCGCRVGIILLVVVILGTLAVPAVSAGTLASPSNRTSGSQLSTNNTGSWGCSRYYVVRRGDNLTRIAYRYGTTVNALMRCNNIWNPDVIYVGQPLCICGGSWHPKPPPPPPPPPPPCQQACRQLCQPQPEPWPCQQTCQQTCQPPPPPPPPPQTAYWLGQYFNNRDLSGWPVLTRNDPALMFNWGYGSPSWEVPPDNFSAQWTRTFHMQEGTWRITLTADDGVRVLVDGVPVLDEWWVTAARTYCRDIVLPAGNHTFTVQYFEAEGVAQVGITIIRL